MNAYLRFRSLLSPDKGLIFRLVHVKCVDHILEHGIHCPNSSVKDRNYVPIGDKTLISRRNNREVPLHPRGTLSDYVPFYFTPYSIMLYKIVTGHGITQIDRSDLVILVSSIDDLTSNSVKWLFTDGHAYTAYTEFFDEESELSRVDWDLLRRRDFRRSEQDPRKLERYQAEALAYQHVPLGAIRGIGCYTEDTTCRIQERISYNRLSFAAKLRPKWFEQ